MTYKLGEKIKMTHDGWSLYMYLFLIKTVEYSKLHLSENNIISSCYSFNLRKIIRNHGNYTVGEWTHFNPIALRTGQNSIEFWPFLCAIGLQKTTLLSPSLLIFSMEVNSY